MTMSRTGSDPLVQGNPLALEPSFVGVEDNEGVERTAVPLGGERPSNEVIGLREWGTNQFFPLRAPQHLRQAAVAAATVLQLPIYDQVLLSR
jgi:hypothetical protein